MTDQVVTAHDVHGFLVQRTDDDARMAVVLKVESDTLGFAFSNELFQSLAIKILEAVTSEPSSSASVSSDAKTLVVPIDRISFDPATDRTSTVQVSGAVGRQRLALKVDAETLIRSFKRFLDVCYPVRPGGSQPEATPSPLSPAALPRVSWAEAKELTFEGFANGAGPQWADKVA